MNIQMFMDQWKGVPAFSEMEDGWTEEMKTKTFDAIDGLVRMYQTLNFDVNVEAELATKITGVVSARFQT